MPVIDCNYLFIALYLHNQFSLGLGMLSTAMTPSIESWHCMSLSLFTSSSTSTTSKLLFITTTPSGKLLQHFYRIPLTESKVRYPSIASYHFFFVDSPELYVRTTYHSTSNHSADVFTLIPARLLSFSDNYNHPPLYSGLSKMCIYYLTHYPHCGCTVSPRRSPVRTTTSGPSARSKNT